MGFLGRRVKKAKEEDWNKISRVVRFIRDTTDAELRLRCGNGRLKVTVFMTLNMKSISDKISWQHMHG